MLVEKWRKSGGSDYTRDQATGRWNESQVKLMCSDASFAYAVLEAMRVPPTAVLDSQDAVGWPKGAFMAMLESTATASSIPAHSVPEANNMIETAKAEEYAPALV